ncbi:MAG: hypothetical protein HRF43_07780, partial [Phycisphaerae bacterium]
MNPEQRMTHWIVLVGVAALVTGTEARVGPSVQGGVSTLADALDQADLIVVAQVSREELIPPELNHDRPRRRRATVEIKVVLKGTADALFSIEYAPFEDFSRQGMIGVLFLKRQGQNRMSLLTAPEQYAISHWPTDFSSTSTVTERVRDLFIEDLVNGNGLEKERALGYLRNLRDPTARPAIRKALAHVDARLRIRGLALLAQLGDVEAVAEGVSIAEQLSKRVAHDGEPLYQEETAWIGSALYDVRDPEALPHLIRALRVDDVPLRKGAVYALREIRS